MTVEGNKEEMLLLDKETATEKADALYAAFKQGEKVDLAAAASYCFYLSSQATDQERTKYINRALELDLAQQAQVQQAYDQSQNQQETVQRERERTERITFFRASKEFKALKQSIVDLNARVSNTNSSFLRGKKPSYVENINKFFSTMEKGALTAFDNALHSLIKLTKEMAKRLDFVKPVYLAASNILDNLVAPLPNQYKRGTVSPN